MFELWEKEENIPPRILLRLFLFESGRWRLDHETRIKHGTSWNSRPGFGL